MSSPRGGRERNESGGEAALNAFYRVAFRRKLYGRREGLRESPKETEATGRPAREKCVYDFSRKGTQPLLAPVLGRSA